MPELNVAHWPDCIEAASWASVVDDPEGGGVDTAATVTAAESLAVPPAPVQLREKLLSLVRVPLDWLPEVALVPDQSPDAAQEVALVEVQVRVEEPPLVTEAGFALSDTVGAGVTGAAAVVKLQV